MDVVYVLGKGSYWRDNELRYSLRSLEQHVRGYNKVVIVGECPKWVKNVLHIPYPDLYHPLTGKERNIMEKLREACRHPEVSDDFFACQDDYVFTQEIKVQGFPYYWDIEMQVYIAGRIIGDPYRESMENTFTALLLNGHNTLYFDIHVPIIYNKNRFRLIMQKHHDDWMLSYGCIIKSLYANSIKAEGMRLPDCKINSRRSRDEILEKIKGRPVFSYGDAGLREDMKDLLKQMFPKKSKYE